MPMCSDFGLKARVAMLQKDITMTALAEHLGVSVSYISDIFRGARKGKTQRQKIIDFLGLEDESDKSQGA